MDNVLQHVLLLIIDFRLSVPVKHVFKSHQTTRRAIFLLPQLSDVHYCLLSDYQAQTNEAAS